MPVLNRAALEASPLADLHTIASELGIDGFRRLRKAELIDVIVERQGGDAGGADEPSGDEAERPARRRGARGGRGRRTRDADSDTDTDPDSDSDSGDAVAEVEEGVTDEGAGDEEEAPAAKPRSRSRSRRVTEDGGDDAEKAERPSRRRRAASADRDDDDTPAGRRRAASSDRDDDDTPAGRRRAASADRDDDDTPAGRRRAASADRDDDDTPAGRRRSTRRDDDEGERDERPSGRGGRGRGGRRDDENGDGDRSSGRGRGGRRDREEEDRVAEGTVELLGNGSGFLRTAPPEPSDDDVYISAAQIRRCELVDGDTIAGPVRPPRRSERFASLVRIDTINGRPADEVAEGTHFDDLPASFPTDRLVLGSEDATLKAIEWLTPLGKGSRAVICGGSHSGKTEALRRLAAVLAGQEGLELTLVLAGARPEELGDWPLEPVAALTFSAGPDALGQAVERAVDTAKRIASRGGDAVLLIDSLDGLHVPVARKALAAARNIVDGGSLTIIAASVHPVGGETTIVTLDAELCRTGRFPALDLAHSGTLRPELLVGEAGAEAIATARAAALAT